MTYHLTVHTIAKHLKKETNKWLCYTAQELYKSRGGLPGLAVPNSPHGLCGHKATLNLNYHVRAQELCEGRGGRPGLPVRNSPYGLCGRKTTLEEEAIVKTRIYQRYG